MTTRRVLVTGVRGKTGAPLAELLAARADVEVLGGSSDPTTVSLAGVRPTAFSWDDPAAWPAATEAIDAVYVVRPDRADAPELVGALLDVVPAGAHVVLLSEQAADQVGPDGWAVRVERAVRDGSRSWTVLRPSWFMQVFTDPRSYRDQLTEAGELPFASGGASVAWIDARDIAAVAERALLDDGHAGAVHELTGPASLSLPRTAQLLGLGLGRPVVHREQSVEDAVAGTEGFEQELTAITFQRVRAGVFAGVTDTVERLTGRPARSLQAFLADTFPRVPVTHDRHAHVAGPFFHGTRSELRVGDELVPGRGSNFQAGRVSNNVYFTGVLETAVWGAELATALAGTDEPGHVYVVEPVGTFEDDPNVTDKRFPGNPTESYRTRSPLRVVGEVPDWPRHDPEVLQGMLDGLAQLREQGRDVIED